ncbi:MULTISPECIES: TetR/AcrR family transcriptional regulator [unclassified Pseudonocardia]|uniref:TetR/AcrR family transcriptional regulator n=1 Tax=unclassified Pseudonocardia TaxID=2619320 RepID=UPI000964E9D1|nr:MULTISPECIES: TetR/AcrR family transcriptional regulator [unclassified Pseudonocardia]MBN9102297.1 helix-turn-helix transcriptional regulator [Pseudonocardia sp.]OJY48726.1 MAG: hypothetical protein BGP03_31595 [Pseudonocardia sp. 73-21]
MSQPSTSRGRPAGRPRQDDPEVLTRARLLTAAARAFGRGYAAMSVRALARELGVSQAAVQHYARTKEALLEAVIDEVMVPRLDAARGRSTAVLTRACDNPAPAPAQLEALLRHRVNALVDNGGLITAVLTDRSPGAARRRERLLAALGPALDEGLGALKALSDHGLVRPMSRSTWTLLLMFVIPNIAPSWALLEQVGVGEPAALVDVLDEVADLLMHGLVP